MECRDRCIPELRTAEDRWCLGTDVHLSSGQLETSWYVETDVYLSSRQLEAGGVKDLLDILVQQVTSVGLVKVDKS